MMRIRRALTLSRSMTSKWPRNMASSHYPPLSSLSPHPKSQLYTPVRLRLDYITLIDHFKILLIFAGDLYEEEQILTWLLTQKDPSGDVIEDLEGERLVQLIEESGSIAVYFCKFSIPEKRAIYLTNTYVLSI